MVGATSVTAHKGQSTSLATFGGAAGAALGAENLCRCQKGQMPSFVAKHAGNGLHGKGGVDGTRHE